MLATRLVWRRNKSWVEMIGCCSNRHRACVARLSTSSKNSMDNASYQVVRNYMFENIPPMRSVHEDIEKEDYKSALDHLNEALKLSRMYGKANKLSCSVLQYMTNLSFITGDLDLGSNTLEHLAKQLLLKQDYYNYYHVVLALCNANLYRNNADSVLEKINQTINLYKSTCSIDISNHCELLFTQGNAYYLKGDFEKAKEFFKLAIRNEANLHKYSRHFVNMYKNDLLNVESLYRHNLGVLYYKEVDEKLLGYKYLKDSIMLGTEVDLNFSYVIDREARLDLSTLKALNTFIHFKLRDQDYVQMYTLMESISQNETNFNGDNCFTVQTNLPFYMAQLKRLIADNLVNMEAYSQAENIYKLNLEELKNSVTCKFLPSYKYECYLNYTNYRDLQNYKIKLDEKFIDNAFDYLEALNYQEIASNESFNEVISLLYIADWNVSLRDPTASFEYDSQHQNAAVRTNPSVGSPQATEKLLE